MSIRRSRNWPTACRNWVSSAFGAFHRRGGATRTGLVLLVPGRPRKASAATPFCVAIAGTSGGVETAVWLAAPARPVVTSGSMGWARRPLLIVTPLLVWISPRSAGLAMSVVIRAEASAASAVELSESPAQSTPGSGRTPSSCCTRCAVLSA